MFFHAIVLINTNYFIISNFSSLALCIKGHLLQDWHPLEICRWFTKTLCSLTLLKPLISNPFVLGTVWVLHGILHTKKSLGWKRAYFGDNFDNKRGVLDQNNYQDGSGQINSKWSVILRSNKVSNKKSCICCKVCRFNYLQIWFANIFLLLLKPDLKGIQAMP